MGQLSMQDQRRVRIFVDEMRAKREARGWSRKDLADRCGYSASTIKSVENYDRPPTPDLARALDGAFETDGYIRGENGAEDTAGTFGRMLDNIGNVKFPEAFRRFSEYLAVAHTLRWYEHGFIPGLLQADGYAEAVLSRGARATPELVKERRADRLERRAVLTRDDPPAPDLMCLIDEFALRRTIGSAVVMAEQMAYLLEMAELPNVTIQVIPDGEGLIGLEGAFIVAESPEGHPDCVYLETAAEGMFMEDAAGVTSMRLRWDSLRTEASRGSESLEFIGRIAEEWKQRQ